ncbi:MAG: HlyD family secretion protein [Flavobacteriales bacterium]
MPNSTPKNEHTKLDELRSDEVQEILGHIPHWTIRWGIALLFVLILMVLGLSYLVKYPDYIQGNVVVKTTQPPVKLLSESSGKLKGLRFSESDVVNTGDVLLEIENPTPRASIDWLKTYLDNLEQTLESENQLFSETELPDSMVLGEAQDIFNKLNTNVLNLNRLRTNAFYKKDLASLKKQIEYYGRLVSISARTIKLGEREFKNAQNEFDKQQHLLNKGIISKTEFHQHEKVYIQNKHQLESYKQAYVQNNISRTTYQNQLNEKQFQQAEEERKLLEAIKTDSRSIKNSINTWKKTNLIVSPISGKLSYLLPVHENLYLGSGTEVVAISPAENSFFGVMTVPTRGIGKVKEGQKVYVKLDNYPHQQFGQLVGVVSSLSAIPTVDKKTGASISRIDIAFENAQITSYHKTLDLQPENIGSAQIVTEDRRIIERIFLFLKETSSR